MPSSSHDAGTFSSFVARHRNELGLLLAIAAVVILTATLDDSYRRNPVENATEILRQTSMLGIFALGAGVVIVSGGIDLSAGAVIAFSGAVFASIALALAPLDSYGAPDTENLSALVLTAALAGTLLAALLIGSFHAWLITVVGLPPFVATLASLVGLRSLARVLVQHVTAAVSSQGRSTQIYLYDDFFAQLGNRWWIPLVIFVAMALLLHLLLSRTVVGRHLFAMGGNEQAAKLSGIRTDRLKWLAYCLSSLTASVAGILYTSYVGMSNPATQGLGYELNAIAAAVVGGCSLSGGLGSVFGIVLGSLFLRVVIDSVAKTVKTNPDEFEGLLVGCLVILAVAFNELRHAGTLRKPFFPGLLGVVNVGILALLAGSISGFIATDNKLATGSVVGAAVLVLLMVKKLVEVRAASRE